MVELLQKIPDQTVYVLQLMDPILSNLSPIHKVRFK